MTSSFASMSTNISLSDNVVDEDKSRPNKKANRLVDFEKRTLWRRASMNKLLGTTLTTRARTERELPSSIAFVRWHAFAITATWAIKAGVWWIGFTLPQVEETQASDTAKFRAKD